MSAPHIVTRDENYIEAVRDGEVVAPAKRQSAGSLWSVVRTDQKAIAPHVKISRHLPKEVHRQLVRAVLKQS